MNRFYHALTLTGIVTEVEVYRGILHLACRSGDVFAVQVTGTTAFTVLRNLDNHSRDRIVAPDGSFDEALLDANTRQNVSLVDALKNLARCVWPNGMVTMQVIQYITDGVYYYEAKEIHVLHSGRTHLPASERYLFEDTHWWLTQIQVMANEWLDDIFGDKRTYLLDDFVGLYRTNLNILGLPTDDNIQEMATLSRFIYGLSSAYLLTGSQRYLDAARAGVKFQRDAFRSLTHDGRYCFWAHARRRLKYGSELIEYSLAGDDYFTIPLYEQIYALAGLTQYFRITGDPEVLNDIRRTVQMFNAFYLDKEKRGYYSHIDYVTRRYDEAALGNDKNRSRKNWNSIGDHIPAYLVNLVLALEPLPEALAGDDEIRTFLHTCKWMLRETSELIITHFPDPASVYVQERFMADWKPDYNWGWQKNRAIVGHNLKIAWNLTRVASYYKGTGNDVAFANELMACADKLGMAMAEHGIDQLRGGCYDAVERIPGNQQAIQFVWGNTKDFWQQEQAILAYLILHGNSEQAAPGYLQLAREMMAFWNTYFLDHDNRGIFFRVTDDGLPVVAGDYANKAGHAVAGYHSFELNFLAHTYIRSFVKTSESDANFVLYFKPDESCSSVNVLPDFFAPGQLQIKSIRVNGMARDTIDPYFFQVRLSEEERGATIIVEFKPNLI